MPNRIVQNGTTRHGETYKTDNPALDHVLLRTLLDRGQQGLDRRPHRFAL